MHKTGPEMNLSDDLSWMPDSASLALLPIRIDQGQKEHVLALRLARAEEGVRPLDKFKMRLLEPGAFARMNRSAVHSSVFIGVNLFVCIMALLFFRLDRKDRVWPWFAALSISLAVKALVELLNAHNLGSMISGSALGYMDGMLLPIPMCLTVLLLMVVLGRTGTTRWRMYLGATILLPVVMACCISLLRIVDEYGGFKQIPREWWIKSVPLLLVFIIGIVWAFVESIRLGIRIMRMRGFVRWLGLGVILAFGAPVLVAALAMVVYAVVGDGATVGEWMSTLLGYLNYVAVPLCFITALAIRSAYQTRMLSRQRDELDQEVHERTAELREERDRSEELLLNILPQEVAEELKQKGSADARHFDQATVLFTDFKGFTAMSELVPPADLLAELNVCFKAFDSIIARHNIEKIKTVGDAYMCASGLPDPQHANAASVVHAALEMQLFIEQRREDRRALGLFAFEMRAGIHTGPVVAGIVGVKKFQYDIWGDTVNTASRMETNGEAGEVNISEATYALVKDEPAPSPSSMMAGDAPGRRTRTTDGRAGPAFQFTSRGRMEVKGKGGVAMWFVRWRILPDRVAEAKMIGGRG